MSDLSEKLLEQAINSVLHGYTQTVPGVDMNGNTVYREERINDLRVALVEKLASKLVSTPEYKDLLVKAFTQDVIKKLQDNALAKISFSDLPYDVKRRFDDECKTMRLEVKKYKLVAETVEPNQ